MVMTIFYPGLIGARSIHDEEEYIPKRRQGISQRIINATIRFIQSMGGRLIDARQQIKSRRRLRRMKLKTRKYECEDSQWSLHTRRYRSSTMMMSVIAMAAGHNEKDVQDQRKILFDSDSDTIGIDNRCSACISHRMDDFIGTPTIEENNQRIWWNQNGKCHDRHNLMGMV